MDELDIKHLGLRDWLKREIVDWSSDKPSMEGKEWSQIEAELVRNMNVTLDNLVSGIEALITERETKAKQEVLKDFIGWIDRNHAIPGDFNDRWCRAAMEIVAEGNNRLAELEQGGKDE